MRIGKLAALAAVAAGPFLGVAALAPATAAADTFIARMSGAQEVPEEGDRDGRGRAVITTNLGDREVCFRIRLRRVGWVSAGHIHRGRAGTAGDVVVELFSERTRRPRGCVRGVSRQIIRRIEDNPGAYYVNVHNRRYPAGAVRGQLRVRDA